MNDTSSITKSQTTQGADESKDEPKTIRPNIEWPLEVWKKVKIASIQADAASPAQFVIDIMAEKVRRVRAA